MFSHLRHCVLSLVAEAVVAEAKQQLDTQLQEREQALAASQQEAAALSSQLQQATDAIGDASGVEKVTGAAVVSWETSLHRKPRVKGRLGRLYREHSGSGGSGGNIQVAYFQGCYGLLLSFTDFYYLSSTLIIFDDLLSSLISSLISSI